jgi:hypothetical protein
MTEEKTAERQMTEGEYRVGVSFNPSKSPMVDDLKAAAAKFIDLCKAVQTAANEAGNSEAARCAAVAMTEAEGAAMWAVKAVTKQPR